MISEIECLRLSSEKDSSNKKLEYGVDLRNSEFSTTTVDTGTITTFGSTSIGQIGLDIRKHQLDLKVPEGA